MLNFKYHPLPQEEANESINAQVSNTFRLL